MCGLISILSLKDNGFSVDEGKMFEYSMIFNQLRGDDSTGAVCIDKDNVWSYIKTVGGFKSFIRHNKFNQWRPMVMNSGRLVFGHGRLATRGTVNVDNAHPFYLKNNDNEIVFMHNGTLATRQSLPGIGLFDVDSEFLGTMIAKHGAEKALSEVDGAIACMWWDVKTNTFNFYRNAERPLYYMALKTGEFYLNSEKWILEFLNWKFKLGAEDKDIYMLKEQDWCSVEVNGDNFGNFINVAIKKPTPVRSYLPHWSKWDDDLGIGAADVTSYRAPWSYAEDGAPQEDKEFWDRNIDLIEWIDGNKRVTYRDRHVITHMNEGPPEPNLMRMYEVRKSGNIMKAYRVEGKEHPLYVEVKFDTWLENKKKRPNLPAPVVSLSKNTIKFTTKHQPTQKKIKHKGTILEGKCLPHLEYYENSLDGSVGLGEVKSVELLYAEEKVSTNGTEMLTKIVCAEIKEKQDSYIDYVFYSKEFSKRQAEEILFFKGIVGSIKVLQKDKANVTGGYCECHLQNVTPIYTDDEPVKGVAAAVEGEIMQQVETTKNEKTIH